jgi:DNA modification methylase
MNYNEFLENKLINLGSSGFDIEEDQLNPILFPFQKAIVKWALHKGKSAIFAECGLGKTPMQLEWAIKVHKETGGNVLILAPLAVSMQTYNEGKKFGINVTVCKSSDDIKDGINITNYERIHKFELEDFAGIVLDESSILKSFTGKIRNQIIESCANIPYKLACTATPAPNDFMELGNHCEFLNVMSRNEMLSMYFINDTQNCKTWRLKKHAEDDYWRFVGSWAVMLNNPSDLQFDGGDFVLPKLEMIKHILEDKSEKETLFSMPATGFQEVRKALKESMIERCQKTADIVNNSSEQFLIWCNYNDESKLLSQLINDSVEVKGSDDPDYKEENLIGFSENKVRVLVTKPSIAGHGLNWQSCHNMIFCGLSYSYESYYQAIRRCWRFGQKQTVNCHLILSEKEIAVLEAIKRKETEHKKMNDNIINNVKIYFTHNIINKKYMTDIIKDDEYTMMLGDSVERIKEIPDNSIDYSVFSPPFSDLYTYSNSERDMGNSLNDDQFYEHFRFLADDLLRVTKNGRLLSFHCMLLPTLKFKAGYIGLKDFRGDMIRIFQDAGFIYVSEVVIWKDPVLAMQRTKAKGLLYKQLRKDATDSRQGLPDYVITMKKPGENLSPVTHTYESFPLEVWQKYASPIWTDINQSETLQRLSAREEKDEKHICPLQLEVIRRCLYLWTNPGDVVLSPFAGIGSEGYESIKLGRKFVGIELKKSYFDQAVRNLEVAKTLQKQQTLF